MGCSGCGTVSTNCSTNGCGKNGNCASDCGKMGTFDWLAGVENPVSYPKFDIVEIRFKGGRKDFYRNSENLDIVIGDAVIVDVHGGHHLGFVSLTGELARLQMKKKKVKDSDEIRKIYRIASSRDLEKFNQLKDKEGSLLYKARDIIAYHRIDMKLSDVEYQADGNKATFYYSADDRVDFRELIKAMASEFKIKVEMRQISLRQEAGRLGGIGSCGRELCCSTWLSDLKSVPTAAARYQNLSINPAKISGQCGRLKCCLNYELDTYMEALKDFPEIKRPLKVAGGELHLEKTDIFKKLMWFSYNQETDWKALHIDRVKEIQALNKKGEFPHEIREAVIEKQEPAVEEERVNLENNLERLDKKLNRQKGGKKRNKRRKNRKPPNNKSNSKPKSNNKNKS